MWLRNWYSMLNALFLSVTNDAIPATNPSNEPALSKRMYDGSYSKMDYQVPASSDSYIYRQLAVGKYNNSFELGSSYDSTSSTGKVTLIFGSGTTPATFDDYRIETPVSGLTLITGNPNLVTKTTYDSATNRYSSKVNFTVTNGSGTQKTITEVALNSAYNGCIYRDVFNPIILENGESIVLEIEFNGLNMIPSQT